MDEGFDTGDIVAQKKLAITPMETMGTLFNRLNILALNLLLETLKKYEKGELTRQKQPEGDYDKGNAISNEKLFIDYNKSAKEIERFVRALNPFLISATVFRKNIVKVYASEAFEDKSERAHAPGTIVKVDDSRFYVATAEGLIAPTVMQFGSFFVGTSKDFIRILGPKVGEKFDG
jgi:methionyl-tRNA formyltransferase